LKHGEDIFETDAVAFVRPDFPTELIITYGGAGAGAVGGQGVTSSGAGRGESARYPLAILANFSEGFPEGRGYSVAAGEQLIIYNTPLELARQLLFVTSQRVELMATFHTKNMVIEQFYPLAVTSLKVADTALSNRQYDEAIANAIRAWSYIRSAYIGTMSLIMDVIATVVFFFLLLIPFGYLTQLLILPKLQGAMKLMGLIAIVLICIAILAAFHPGFYIATNVYMIILAVAVAVIGLTVVSKTLGEALASAGAHREKLLGAHMISYSKTAALALSFSVGIENMRKRKLRTSLTLISLIIMTTALVVLTSASVYMYLSSSKMEGPISYQGLLVRDPNFSPQAELMKDVLRGLYKTEGLVAPRTWVAQPQGFLLAPGISIKAVFGLTPTEESLTNVSKALVKGRWLSETDRTTCLLSESLARKLDVDIGGQVRWLGLNLSVIGILDDAKMTNVKDLDMLRLAPVIFVEGALTTLAPSEFIIVPYDLLMSNYATTPYSIAVKLNDEKTVMPIAQQLALQTQRLNVYAGVRGEVVVLTTQSWYGVTGASMLTVPVILTALTVLNVIIGSVYERMKEITVYTVVGLTPTHISGLFISESVLFAVVSAVGGYLIAMSILGLMDLLHLILPGQFINYASTFVIVAVVSTMLTAILASLYPALKASRLAIPSLERKWRIPTSPTQDYWFIPLPFMATFEEVGGVISYLKEYIDASTKAFGAFVSEGSEVAITPNRIALSFVARLAPYDLGIMQKTSITALAETSRKIKSSTFNFAIEVYRRSGHRDSWILSNRVFIDLIRKQFLYWRALPPSRKGEYIKAFSKMTQERFQDEAGGEIGA
jgi:ABC-type antimicrobial peptide transport system permease subunit